MSSKALTFIIPFMGFILPQELEDGLTSGSEPIFNDPKILLSPSCIWVKAFLVWL